MAAPALATLMGAQSNAEVAAFFNLCFRHRHTLDTVNSSKVESWFSCDDTAARKLLEAGRDVVLSALYVSASITEEAEVAAFLRNDLDKRLVKLICSVVLKLLPVWRKASVDTRVAMPRLVDVDWRVDVKTSAEALTRMSVPTLLVDMKVRDQPTKVGVMPAVRGVNFEMSREALTTMLTGLHKIRDQLTVLNQ